MSQSPTDVPAALHRLMKAHVGGTDGRISIEHVVTAARSSSDRTVYRWADESCRNVPDIEEAANIVGDPIFPIDFRKGMADLVVCKAKDLRVTICDRPAMRVCPLTPAARTLARVSDLIEQLVEALNDDRIDDTEEAAIQGVLLQIDRGIADVRAALASRTTRRVG